jgi:predicted oxidoreductase
MPLVVNQIELSLARLDAFHDGTLDQCLLENVTPQAWSPLGGGRLASADPPDLQSPDHAHRIHLREIIDLIARQHGVTREIVALAWLLLHPAHVNPIVGTTNPARIRDLARADETRLTREEWYQLLEAALGERLP